MKILLAEDEAISRRLLEVTLTKWKYEVISCSDGSQAWKALQVEEPPQLLILDWIMPGMDGIQICRELRKQTRRLYSYILLLTAKNDKREITEGLDAGADDYLTEPFDARELEARLRAGRRILGLQSKLLEAQEAMRFQASHDLLTGMWNRAEIVNILERELSRAAREYKPVGVVMVDLDYFKQINDTYGHQAGHRVLREAARRMDEAMRPYDGLGRYGGEEFLVILPGCNWITAGIVAERLRAALTAAPVSLGQVAISITCSLGVASTTLMAQPRAKELIDIADRALYRAKNRGRNRVELGEWPSVE